MRFFIWYILIYWINFLQSFLLSLLVKNFKLNLFILKRSLFNQAFPFNFQLFIYILNIIIIQYRKIWWTALIFNTLFMKHLLELKWFIFGYSCYSIILTPDHIQNMKLGLLIFFLFFEFELHSVLQNLQVSNSSIVHFLQLHLIFQ